MTTAAGNTQKENGLVRFLKSLRGVSASDMDKLISDLEVGKAGAPTAEGLTTGEVVEDRWMEGEMHKVPGKEELKTGPAFGASGGSAESMIREYSRPAPQQGITVEAERLGEELGQMRGYMKALGSEIVKLAKGQSALVSLLAKAAEHEDEASSEDEEDEEESEVVEINASKAKDLLAKAKAKYAVAVKAREDAEDCDGEERKALRAKARAARKSAAKLLHKARIAALVSKAKSGEVRKGIREFLKANPTLKADINVVQEEEEDEEEEDAEEQTKSQTAAAATTTTAAAPAAKSDDKGNQADKQDPTTGNQDDAAAKSVNDTLAGLQNQLGVVTKSLAEVMDQIGNKSAGGAKPPAATGINLLKGDVDATISRYIQLIDDQQDGGSLTDGQAMSARNIVAKIDAVRKGTITEETLKELIDKSPNRVQMLFRDAA